MKFAKGVDDFEMKTDEMGIVFCLISNVMAVHLEFSTVERKFGIVICFYEYLMS